MTREEAITRLHNIMGFDYHYLPADDAEAMDMAIEALKQPQIICCENCHYYEGEHCDMHNGGTYPTDYCSYAVWKYEEDES